MNSNHNISRQIEHLVIFLTFNHTNASNELTLFLIKGDEIRALKGQKADKAVVSAAVKELLSLKEK
jgi:hypothetical protein